jgi:hypothetical protein
MKNLMILFLSLLSLQAFGQSSLRPDGIEQLHDLINDWRAAHSKIQYSKNLEVNGKPLKMSVPSGNVSIEVTPAKAANAIEIKLTNVTDTKTEFEVIIKKPNLLLIETDRINNNGQRVNQVIQVDLQVTEHFDSYRDSYVVSSIEECKQTLTFTYADSRNEKIDLSQYGYKYRYAIEYFNLHN